MRLMIICVLGAAVFAASCIYDISSQEPSPLAGLVTAASAASSATGLSLLRDDKGERQ
ncbi:hypothetical protein [Rhizobium binae]|uniref:Lipoprotein n=1 Tax=Rhizobium binae TaxID=1138190 RepID=A0ABV2MAS7_9HYPH|nr:hypothetical protein [Rhizobium binae]MBX4929199.1 hypothetical protein [Rhizobium binae]MBX4937266.1 hypothetical protein [Rhizobium binae]MBX4943346.1 hypothetical protein [Rhizobium binae]MBX4953397.1 hypothetical protein [Rhizobium binae]MBX4959996.1 hypothetical protein [Rhizobium binae]